MTNSRVCGERYLVNTSRLLSASKSKIDESDNSFSMEVLNEEFSKPGENVPIDLTKLIVSVHLTPGASGNMEKLVSDVVNGNDLNIPVIRSKLDDEPI